jgi:hypothetical protein
MLDPGLTPELAGDSWTPEPITAWRTWDMDYVTNRMRSTTIMQLWQKEMPVARCLPWGTLPSSVSVHDSAPHLGCRCGYWSIKPEKLHSPKDWALIVRGPASTIAVGLVGMVEQWGVVDEYEHGYKSSHIKITAFLDFTDAWIEEHANEHNGRGGWMYLTERHRALFRTRTNQQAAVFDVPVILHA